MNELQIFNNPKFGQIRTIEENGKALFCASDVAKALGYERPNNAVNAHCRYTLKRGIPHPQNKLKTIEMLFIPIGDVYRLAAHSELPSAEEFESWIYDEVVPSVCQHGVYMTPETIEKTLSDPDFIIRIATELKKEQTLRSQLQEQIEEDRPKVIFAEAVSASNTSILIGDLAKLLKQNGVNTGQKRLFTQLREDGYLIKSGSSKNMPTQKAMEMGLFEVKEGSYVDANGCNITTKTTKVTGKGQQYFINRYLAGAISRQLEMVTQ